MRHLEEGSNSYPSPRPGKRQGQAGESRRPPFLLAFYARPLYRGLRCGLTEGSRFTPVFPPTVPTVRACVRGAGFLLATAASLLIPTAAEASCGRHVLVAGQQAVTPTPCQP